MICNTRGIVLRTIKHSDSSVIVNIYTEDFGLQGFMVNIGKTPKSRGKANLLQALSILDITAHVRDNRNLQRMKEFSSHFVFVAIQALTDPYEYI